MKNKITIIIPCHNEEKGIGRVIDNIPKQLLERQGYEVEIIVVNNNSKDKTEQIALERNVRVINEHKRGKGNAIKAGFNAVTDDTLYVVMLDGDNTYKSHEMPRLLEPLANDFCDVIVGSRLGGKINKNSWKFQNRIVNWGYTFLVRQFYRANVTDVLSGYFAWKKPVIDVLKLHLKSEGFAIEMEMITKMVKLGYEVYSVPITYDERIGHTKIQPLNDGIKIVHMLFKNLIWSPNYKRMQKLHLDNLYKI